MTFPRWRQSLARSLHLSRSQAQAKFFQVANAYFAPSSVNSDDSEIKQIVVENRTMVHRGFLDNTHIILAITDARSDKVSQWKLSAQANICWYFTKSREQYRISAKIALIDKSGLIHEQQNQSYGTLDKAKLLTIRSTMWSNLSEKAKAQFYWPAPKTVMEETNSGAQKRNDSDIPDTFTVVCFDPYYVDYLSLATEPQTRETHKIVDSQWVYCKVNP